jgi:hypothetical protein
MSEFPWTEQIAQLPHDEQAHVIGRINGNVETREVSPGVWEHTFTPENTPVPADSLWWQYVAENAPNPLDLTEFVYGPPVAEIRGGILSVADIDAVIASMRDNARAEPDILYVSPGTLRVIKYAQRIGRLYRAHPVPHGKIRKCHMRKLQARWRAGKAHIRRVEAAERAREEAEMHRMREEYGG